MLLLRSNTQGFVKWLLPLNSRKEFYHPLALQQRRLFTSRPPHTLGFNPLFSSIPSSFSTSTPHTLVFNPLFSSIPSSSILTLFRRDIHGGSFGGVAFSPSSSSSSSSSQIRELNEDGSYKVKGGGERPIFELDEETFDLISSSTVPVLVEAYVRDATPQLQEYSEKLKKLVLEKSGFLRLARLDVSAQQSIVEELKISHVPSLIGIIEGKMFYNRLVGIPTDNVLKKYVNALFAYTYGRDTDQLLLEADTHLEQNNITEAAKIFNTFLTDNKYTFAAAFGLAGLIQCALKEGNVEVAHQLAETLKTDYEDSVSVPRIKQAITQAELQNISDGSTQDNVEELKQKVQQNPKDLQSRYDLALYYQKVGKYEQATAELFQIIKTDREWNEQAAKTMILKIFDSLGDEHELTIKGRRRLHNIWFT